MRRHRHIGVSNTKGLRKNRLFLLGLPFTLWLGQPQVAHSQTIAEGVVPVFPEWPLSSSISTQGFGGQVGGFGGFGSNATDELKQRQLTVITEKVWVKGFPTVVQLRARGPLAFPKLTLSDRVAEMGVTLSSLHAGPRWALVAYDNRGSNMTLGSPFGGMMDGRGIARQQNYLLLQPGEQVEAVFDLSALSVDTNKATFGQVPPGHYQLQITIGEVGAQGTTSPPIEIEIREPSPSEREFLRDTGARWVAHLEDINGQKRTGRNASPEAFNWPTFLRGPVPLGQPKGLSSEARCQLAPYLLLSDIMSSRDALKRYPLRELKQFHLPAYMEAERLLWQYEMLHARGELGQAGRIYQQIAAQHLGSLWRVPEIDRREGYLRTYIPRPIEWLTNRATKPVRVAP